MAVLNVNVAVFVCASKVTALGVTVGPAGSCWTTMSSSPRLGPTFWLNVNVSRCGSVAKLKFDALTAGGAAPITVFVVDAGGPFSPASSFACAQYVYVPSASPTVEALADQNPPTSLVA